MSIILRNKMKRLQHLSVPRIAVATIISIALMAFFLMGYLPFCKISMFDSVYEKANNPYETIQDHIIRIKKYIKLMSIDKGDLYNFVDHNGENVCVHLGWDNRIHIKKDDEEKIITVKHIQYFHGKSPIPYRQGDSIVINKNVYRDFDGVEFMGSKSKSVCIYKQPDDLPFGNQKYGFVIYAEEWILMSGQINLFDY